MVPNQGIWDSVGNTLSFSWVGGITGSLLTSIAFSVVTFRSEEIFPEANLVILYGLIGLWGGSLIGALMSSIALMQHFALRTIISLSNFMPWNFKRFLNYASELAILKKVGGGYIFTHRLLLEYFAKRS